LLRGRAEPPLPDGNGAWQVSVNGRSQQYSRVVIAAGAWSPQLLRPLGIPLRLESQRGYHVQFSGASDAVSRTVVLADRKIFVTPMQEGLRVGGTVEIAGLERAPDMRRARVLERIARASFRGLETVPAAHWMGHRPCMPDSVPVIGPVAGHPGLWLATGHGHLGLTGAPATAERIADGIIAAMQAA
jgi:D-amino-acid dehydrogenase